MIPASHVHISVIIPLFNRASLIENTLQSIQSQTYPHWEAVVVDDGSIDGSFERVEQLARHDKRIVLLHRDREPKGAPTCRNIGADAASGEYLIFLDSDDLLAAFCLKQRIECIQQYPDADFLIFSMLSFHHKPGDNNILWNVSTQEDDLTRFLRSDAVWQTTCPVYKKSFWEKYTGFDENLPYWQDFELHTRLLINQPTYVKCMDYPPDCFYRQHSGSTLSQGQTQSLSRLEVMTTTYQKLTNLLIQHDAFTKERKQAARSMLFQLSVNQIGTAKNLVKGLSTWLYCYESGLENPYRFVIGYGCLSLKFLSVYLPAMSRWFNLFYKLTVRFLPRSYRLRESTMHRIVYRPSDLKATKEHA